MCKFVSLWRLRVLDLVEQSWWHRAVEYQVSIEELDFLDRLPSPDWGRGRRGLVVGSFDIVLLMLYWGRYLMRIWAVGPIRLENRSGVHVVLPVMRSLL